MPAWILWLCPVVIAPMLAVAWTSWASRTRGPEEAYGTVAQYDRFRQAMDAPVPGNRARSHPKRSKSSRPN